MMKREEIIDTFRLLVELKNERSIPEEHKNEVDRCIRYLEESLKKNDSKKISINADIVGTIAAIFKAWLFPP